MGWVFLGWSQRVSGQLPSIHPLPPLSRGHYRVKHPNILQLVDVYITRKEYFIFLEL